MSQVAITALIILGKQDIVSRQPMHLRAEHALGMHRIQGEDAPFDQVRRQQRLECADLILFRLHIAMPQHNAGGHLITAELMDRWHLRTGRTNGFAINGQMRMIGLALRRL
jgi:hypothetical protein